MTVSQVNILDGSLHPLEMPKKKKQCPLEKSPFLDSPPLQPRVFLNQCGQLLSLLCDKVKKKDYLSLSLSYIFPLFTPCNQRDIGMAMYFMHLGQ